MRSPLYRTTAIWLSFWAAFSATHAVASDATWFCSATEKGFDKPILFKVEVKGGQLFSPAYTDHIDKWLLEYPQRTDHGWKKPSAGELKETEAQFNVKTYKIMEDTKKTLVAAYAYLSDGNKDTTIDLLLINKTSGEFRQSTIGMKPADDAGFEGKCLLSK